MKRILFIIVCSPLFTSAQEFSKTLQDNSFFIEEAYNQEEGVVQHIFTGTGNSGSVFSEASFTQEWPVGGQTHQLSYTIPYFLRSTTPSTHGVGDILLNYRYQAVNTNGLAIAPRLSLILSTGDETQGFGHGTAGMQYNLPVSKRWSNEFITHANVEFTWLPDVVSGSVAATQMTYVTGMSGIFLVNKNFNIMAEILFSSTTFGNFPAANEFTLSPGVRYAIDIGEVQIVPGLAFPLYFHNGGQENGIFFYLSFEHPF